MILVNWTRARFLTQKQINNSWGLYDSANKTRIPKQISTTIISTSRLHIQWSCARMVANVEYEVECKLHHWKSELPRPRTIQKPDICILRTPNGNCSAGYCYIDSWAVTEWRIIEERYSCPEMVSWLFMRGGRCVYMATIYTRWSAWRRAASYE